MKFVITTILLSALCTFALAQTNILEQLHVKNPTWYSFIEKGNYYYVLSNVEGGEADIITSRKPGIQFLNKYNKQNGNLVASVFIAGDTLQSDSMLTPATIMINRDDKLYILFNMTDASISPYTGMYYFMKLDTALNVIVPKKYLWSDWGLILGGTAIQDNGRCVIGYHTSSAVSTGSSKYLLLDSMGNELADDSLGAPDSRPVSLRQIVNLPDNKFLVTGNMISGNATPEQQFGWTTTDSNMTTLDTFLYKKGLDQSWEPFTFSIAKPHMVALPTGSLISGSCLPPLGGDSYSAYPLIAKHSAATRYGVDEFISFLPLDNTDTAHGSASAITALQYNSHDNYVYFASITHRAVLGLACAGNSYKSRLEIICVDTSLNLRWRKFIKMEGICSALSSVSLPDGRNGIIAVGVSAFNDNTLKSWAYYINDNTPSDNPTDINDVAIKKEDGFVLYPIPAEDEVHLIALDKEFKEANLYDLNGRLLLTQPIILGRAVFNTTQLSPGIYLIKSMDKKGNSYYKKMVKR